MIYVGTCENNTKSEMQYPLALAKSLNPNIGENVGDYIYYKFPNGREYCAEITAKKGNKLQLVACGWVRRKYCRLKR